MTAHRGTETPGDFLCSHQQPVQCVGIAGRGRPDEARVVIVPLASHALVNRIQARSFGDTSGTDTLCHRSLFHESLSEMIRRALGFLLAATLGLTAPAVAQTPLTLTEAIARARAQNPDAGSTAATEREAALRIQQSRAGYWPRVDVAESWQRGNQPVFVFSSLLAQRQFSAADFALEALNRPDAVNNFRAAVTVEQSLFDAGTRANVAAAGISRDVATAGRLAVDRDLAAGVTAAYGRVLIAAAARESAAAAAETARADREVAGNRRDAGRGTDADVLQLDVYLSRTREQQIRAAADERVARAELNQLMGVPLGASFVLDRVVAAPAVDTGDLASLEAEALTNSPDVKVAALQVQLAEANASAARGA